VSVIAMVDTPHANRLPRTMGDSVLRDRYRNKFTREATVGRETCRTYYR
jgi:hypothetical protein